MTLRILLIRHAAHDLLGEVLCGRMNSVPLNARGVGQAEALGRIVARERPNRVFTSPVLRAHQTGSIIARSCGHPVQIEPALNEIDFGHWTGARFTALQGDAAWHDWNRQRSRHRPPGGESMQDVQSRLAAWIASMSSECDGAIAAVSHADVIKAACCLALDLPIDSFDRFDIDPSSVSELRVGSWGMKLAYLNRTGQ